MKAKKELLVAVVILGALVIMFVLWHSWQQHIHYMPTISPTALR